MTRELATLSSCQGTVEDGDWKVRQRVYRLANTWTSHNPIIAPFPGLIARARLQRKRSNRGGSASLSGRHITVMPDIDCS